jgi:hypothetical protein
MTRSSCDQKSQARYAAVAETRDSDISIYSSGSINKVNKKRISMVELEKETKRKKVTPPMHPISARKVAIVPQTVMTSPHYPPWTGNSLRNIQNF